MKNSKFENKSAAGRVSPGLKPVLELLEQSPQRIEKIYCKKNLQHGADLKIIAMCQKNFLPFEYAEIAFLDELCQNGQKNCGNVNHQGVIAILSETNSHSLSEIFDMVKVSPLPLVLALDQIQDPGNLGTLSRTAYSLGCAGIILPKHNSTLPGAGALRSSAGALNKLPVAIVTNLARALDDAEEAGLTIYGTAVASNTGLPVENAFTHEWHLPAVLVLGNENKGIRPGVAKRCGIFVTIPLARRFDSLNIAQAGAILLGLCAAYNMT